MAAGVLVVGAALFAMLPGMVDRHYNGVHGLPFKAPSAAALALHRSLRIADLHADALLWNRNLTRRNAGGHVDIPRLVEGNIALQAFAVVTKTPRGLNIDSNDDQSDSITLLGIAQGQPPATWNSLLRRALARAERLHAAARASGGSLRVVASGAELSDFLAARAAGRAAAAGWLTLEGGHALEGKLANLDLLYRAGYRMVAPTHFFDTELSGSEHGRAKGGLTALGRDWVRAMERRRMIVDLAHASERTQAEVLAMATRPVIVSHTGVRATCANRRNLSDAQLRAVAANGGLVGIGFWETAVCGRDEAAIARAIKHAVAVAGERHVAFGSDFDGAVTTPFDAAGMARLTQALLDAGLSEAQVRRVAGENVIDFLLRNLPPVS